MAACESGPAVGSEHAGLGQAVSRGQLPSGSMAFYDCAKPGCGQSGRPRALLPRTSMKAAGRFLSCFQVNAGLVLCSFPGADEPRQGHEA